jgi:hypothetical protein
LAGIVTAGKSYSCLLTDYDKEAIQLIHETFEVNEDNRRSKYCILFSSNTTNYGCIQEIYGWIAYSKETTINGKSRPSTLFVIGQANRESQWDLFHNIKNGCYNQLTDKREPPWALYNLQISSFCENIEACDSIIDGFVPIPVIIHLDTENCSQLCPFKKFAHEVTEVDFERILNFFKDNTQFKYARTNYSFSILPYRTLPTYRIRNFCLI